MKSPVKIKKQIEFWFLKFHQKNYDYFNGNEAFTLFDKVKQGERLRINDQVILRKEEIPVLLLKVSNKHLILNTTERFIRIDERGVEYIEYTDFKSHLGFNFQTAKERAKLEPNWIKIDGSTCTFRLLMINGQELQWEIPTGKPGFGFWNVTKNCELIGRKYLE